MIILFILFSITFFGLAVLKESWNGEKNTISIIIEKIVTCFKKPYIIFTIFIFSINFTLQIFTIINDSKLSENEYYKSKSVALLKNIEVEVRNYSSGERRIEYMKSLVSLNEKIDKNEILILRYKVIINKIKKFLH